MNIHNLDCFLNRTHFSSLPSESYVFLSVCTASSGLSLCDNAEKAAVFPHNINFCGQCVEQWECEESLHGGVAIRQQGVCKRSTYTLTKLLDGLL